MKSMNTETLVSGLCRVNGQQGGTIHQFMGRQDWGEMSAHYQDIVDSWKGFKTREDFERLAAKHHLTIRWE